MRLPTILLSIAILPGIAMAAKGDQIPMKGSPPEYTPQTTSKPSLFDLLTIEPSASIFFSYARELELSSIFSDGNAKISVFAPTNKAVMALARKPHQGPETVDEIEVSDEEYHKTAQKFVESWVSAHIVPEFPFLFDVQEHKTLLHHKSITLNPTNKKDGSEWNQCTLEDGISIIGKREAFNGDLYLIDGAISAE